MRDTINLVIIVLLAVIVIRMGHLIDAYAESPISRQWIANIPLDCPVYGTLNIPRQDEFRANCAEIG